MRAHKFSGKAADKIAAAGGAASIEVVKGPFKGFKGYVTSAEAGTGGSVDAKLVIFGRETDVTLEAGEFVTL